MVDRGGIKAAMFFVVFILHAVVAPTRGHALPTALAPPRETRFAGMRGADTGPVLNLSRQPLGVLSLSLPERSELIDDGAGGRLEGGMPLPRDHGDWHLEIAAREPPAELDEECVSSLSRPCGALLPPESRVLVVATFARDEWDALEILAWETRGDARLIVVHLEDEDMGWVETPRYGRFDHIRAISCETLEMAPWCAADFIFSASDYEDDLPRVVVVGGSTTDIVLASVLRGAKEEDLPLRLAGDRAMYAVRFEDRLSLSPSESTSRGVPILISEEARNISDAVYDARRHYCYEANVQARHLGADPFSLPLRGCPVHAHCDSPLAGLTKAARCGSERFPRLHSRPDPREEHCQTRCERTSELYGRCVTYLDGRWARVCVGAMPWRTLRLIDEECRVVDTFQ